MDAKLSLLADPAAIYVQRLSGDVAGVVGSEEGGGTTDLARLARASE